MDAMWLNRESVDQQLVGVDFTELRYDPDSGLYCHNGEPFTGVSKARAANGKLDGLAHHRAGVEEGVSVGWYPNGRIRVYSEMSDDVYHGWHIEWDEEGNKLVETHFTMGEEDEAGV